MTLKLIIKRINPLLFVFLIIQMTIIPISTAVDTAKKITIGVIESDSGAYEPKIIQWAEKDINNYMEDNNLGYVFDFILEDAQGSSETHLEKIKMFHDDGVDLIIGGGWSSMAMHALDFITLNNVLLLSYSSTSTELTLEDNLFRLSPPDSYQASAITSTLKDRGIKAIIMFQRDDTWGNGLYRYILEECNEKGIIILKRLIVNPGQSDFKSQLAEAESYIQENKENYGSDNIGVLVITFNEAIELVKQAKDFPNTYELTWFGTETIAYNEGIKDRAFREAAHVGLYSTMATGPISTEKYTLLNERFEREFRTPISFYMSALYDSAWIYALSVVEAGSTEPSDIKNVLQEVAGSFEGASGICELDENGDRKLSNYHIWGYRTVNRKYTNEKIGFYDGTTLKITWYISLPRVMELSCTVPDTSLIGETINIICKTNPFWPEKEILLRIIDPSANSFEQTLITNSTGGQSFELTLNQIGDWKFSLVAESEMDYKSAVSLIEVTSVEKHPSILSISVSSDKIKQGYSVEISGNLIPIILGEKIVVSYSNGVSEELEIKTLQGGRYSYSLTFEDFGDYYIESYWNGNEMYQDAKSDGVSFKVLPLTGFLEIVVIDEDGNPLQDVKIKMIDNPLGQDSLSGLSDSDGELVFNDISLGDYTIEAEYGGYETGKESITLSTEDKKAITITLKEIVVTSQEEPRGRGIPGFPIKGIFLGLILTVIIIWINQKNSYYSKN
jgi:branched-chain amino acid transport system substrate-binding protein